MCEKKLHMFVLVTGEYVSLSDIKRIRKTQFDDTDAVVDRLKGESIPTDALWGKLRAGGTVIIDLSDKFNQEALGVQIEDRAYNWKKIEVEAERLIVEEWHRLNKKRKKKKKKKKLAKKQ